jgi:nicotinamidase-related amidase
MKNLTIITVLFLIVSVAYTGAQQSDEQKAKQMKPVLVIIDIQNKYLPYMDDADKKMGLEVINWAIWLFREHGYPVVRVYHTDPKWGPEPGTEDFEFPSSINITDEDPKVIKNYANAFNKTNLEEVIREKEGNTLFLCGLSAVGCVLATYNGAQDRDFNVFMVKDALLSHNATYTNFVEEAFETVSVSTMKVMLEYAQK